MDLKISDAMIGKGQPIYIIAELSANHNQQFDAAVKLIHAAKSAGADAVKLQTYTPDTLTIDANNKYFRIKGTLWNGKTLYNLYQEAYTPWEWQPRLKEYAEEIGIALFSTPFDSTAVEFLEKMDVPAYKIASFEIVDIPLLRCVAETGKPVIISTGMSTLDEISEAVDTVQRTGNMNIALLKCTSAYPSLPEDMNLKMIPFLEKKFDGIPIGLSDHSMTNEVPIAAVTLGARIIEKHLTLSRNDRGPDSGFSLEPHEFKSMVQSIRTTEKALGEITNSIGARERTSLIFRRSLFVVKNVKAGERFTKHNICSIRPGHGLHPRNFDNVLGQKAKMDISRGTPLNWDHISA